MYSTSGASSALFTLLSFGIISTCLLHSTKQKIESEPNECENSEEKMAAKMAHEIRTPLTAVSSAAQLLKQNNSHHTNEQAQLLEQIIEQSERVDKVIQQLLDESEFSHSDLTQLMKLNLTKKNTI